MALSTEHSHHADSRAGERGFALIAVLFFVFVISMTAISFYGLAQSEGRHAEYDRDAAQSFWAAETANDRAIVHLSGLIQPPRSSLTLFTGQKVGDATYEVNVIPDPANNTSPEKLFTLRSTGRCGRQSRVVEEVVRMEGFARYGYFTNQDVGPNGSPIWFITGDDIGGRTHTNGIFHFSGRPRFRGEVTSARDHAVAYPGTNIHHQDDFPAGNNDPRFDQGFQLDTPDIPLPNDTGDIRAAAQADGIVFGTSREIVFGAPAPGWFSHKALGAAGAGTPVNMALFREGVIHVTGTARISGVVDGIVTLGATGDIELVDDLRYAAADIITGQPNPGCDDIMGLVSEGNIVVRNVAGTQGDMIVDATVMALGTSFGAENYNQGVPRGTIHLWGGLIQERRGAVGTFSNNVIRTGYLKDYHYDDRVRIQPPPQFPLTGVYTRVSWRELAAAS